MKRNMMKMLVLAGTMGLATTVLAQETIKTTLVSGTGNDREEGPAMICDGDFSTKWCVDEPSLMPYTIILDAGSPTSFAEYGFVTGNDTQDYPDRNPVTWVLSGSNDKQNWTVMDKQENDRTLRDENHQEYLFKPAQKGGSSSWSNAHLSKSFFDLPYKLRGFSFSTIFVSRSFSVALSVAVCLMIS